MFRSPVEENSSTWVPNVKTPVVDPPLVVDREAYSSYEGVGGFRVGRNNSPLTIKGVQRCREKECYLNLTIL